MVSSCVSKLTSRLSLMSGTDESAQYASGSGEGQRIGEM